MRVRVRGWFRSLTFVPWHELELDRAAQIDDRLASELRELIASEPGSAMVLRRLVYELDPAAESASTDDELVARVLGLLQRRAIGVEETPELPRASDPIVLYDKIEYEPPESFEDDVLLFWVESEADAWPELDVESESELWPDVDTRSNHEELDFTTDTEPETLGFDVGGLGD